MTLRVPHIFDYSVPLHSGHSFRALAILKEQRRLGWGTPKLTASNCYCATADEE